jgi:hypothetical protein
VQQGSSSTVRHTRAYSRHACLAATNMILQLQDIIKQTLAALGSVRSVHSLNCAQHKVLPN